MANAAAVKPAVIRKVSRECLRRDAAIAAACDEDTEGRKPVAIAARNPESVDVVYSLLFMLGNSWSCGGISGLVFRLMIKMEEPNNPESRGRRGCERGRLRVVNPNVAASRTMINAKSFAFSLARKKRIVAASRKGMRNLITGNIPAARGMIIGARRESRTIADNAPTDV